MHSARPKRKVRFADQPPRTRSAAPDPTRLKLLWQGRGGNKGFGSRHVGGDYKALGRLSGLTFSTVQEPIAFANRVSVIKSLC
jgi:hypothetical protein